MHLLQFLTANLDDSYEIFFNPYLNGDRPDIVVLRYGYGVLIFEVKDWKLKNFEVGDDKKWIYKCDNSIVKSPTEQVYEYKENFINLHIEGFLEKRIEQFINSNAVSCVVYFHLATEKEVLEKFKCDHKYKKQQYYDLDLWGNDSLTKDKMEGLLRNRYISRESKYQLTDSIYKNIRGILEPSIHLKEQGKQLNFDAEQNKIIYSEKQVQRVSGVFGSGKTYVLVNRAVQAYKRACKYKQPEEVKILILTFNITLKNYIRDILNNVPEEFDSNSFTIIHYHKFINGELNNLKVVPKEPNTEAPIEEKDLDYLERRYYSNIIFFKKNKESLSWFDAILIDEIQDYRYDWMCILRECFLTPRGEYILFGDVKQNIYGREIDGKDVRTNVIGRPIKLNNCYRSYTKVYDLSLSYQKLYLNKYILDERIEKSSSFDFST